MIAFLYAFLFGGVVALAGGGSGSSGSTTTTAATGRDTPATKDDDSTDNAEDVTDDVAAPTEPLVADTPAVVLDGASSAPNLPNSAYDIGWAGLTAEEQLIVEMVNRARLDPQAESNLYNEGLASGIPSYSVQALAVSPELSDAARSHSEDMDDRDFFSHTSPDGDGPGTRALEAGHGSQYVGENIGWSGSTFRPDTQARAESHHEGLWRSDGHQRNLMNEDWSEIGLGYDYGDYLGYDHSTFVTELFGDKGDTFLTGVVIDDQDDDDFYDIGEGQGDVRITAYSGEDAFATATWGSGGYSLALPPGTYRVVFEGGELDAPYETDVTIGDENVKLDVIEDGGRVLASLNASLPLPSVPVVEVEHTLSYDSDAEEDLLELI